MKRLHFLSRHPLQILLFSHWSLYPKISPSHMLSSRSNRWGDNGDQWVQCRRLPIVASYHMYLLGNGIFANNSPLSFWLIPTDARIAECFHCDKWWIVSKTREARNQGISGDPREEDLNEGSAHSNCTKKGANSFTRHRDCDNYWSLLIARVDNR